MRTNRRILQLLNLFAVEISRSGNCKKVATKKVGFYGI